MKKLVEKHPLAIRWFHWVNFPVLALMIWSGILIYWANDVYRVGWGDTTLLQFFPQSFYDAFHVDHKLAQGMSWHFVLMWVFALNGLLYVGYTLISGEWRELVPNRGSFASAWRTILHDLGIRKESLPVHKFNGVQQIAYTSVVLMGAGSLLTGLAIYKPTQLAWLTTALGGYEWARAEHFILTIGYVLFFVVHIAQVVRAGWNNFRAMVAGFEVVEVPAPAPAPLQPTTSPDSSVNAS
ncbi:thiosulfate reductase cytochrome b subunit (membrane anchoring protein)-like protein [Hymenobacter roseosalivarius DSM 11622]|uniref:Thiosulfate reductase cytochrome b subunit (Membrane anchoring protein)-like protein n=1 Tax=Hymenobacter roseosalivarius DSM 11622 TaxID=645990 RepID=A0A1W1VYZ3_9BACT|nr:cytochrome b/b6 domain-containing protein [Hymenobacter roseosalivarius]SMB98602.1 thiosulfate reductase cytochrome b subunit (membrane anchoring protein)-like protein [Hymenobacter roseosalivarius DSM 11622]